MIRQFRLSPPLKAALTSPASHLKALAEFARREWQAGLSGHCAGALPPLDLSHTTMSGCSFCPSSVGRSLPSTLSGCAASCGHCALALTILHTQPIISARIRKNVEGGIGIEIG